MVVSPGHSSCWPNNDNQRRGGGQEEQHEEHKEHEQQGRRATNLAPESPGRKQARACEQTLNYWVASKVRYG